MKASMHMPRCLPSWWMHSHTNMHTPATLLTVHAFGVIVSAATKGSIEILDRESFAKIEEEIESATVKTLEISHVNRILMVFLCFECLLIYFSRRFSTPATHAAFFPVCDMSHEHLASPDASSQTELIYTFFSFGSMGMHVSTQKHGI
jgi:hypothetical protein